MDIYHKPLCAWELFYFFILDFISGMVKIKNVGVVGECCSVCVCI